jgi:hypothetical protein
MSEFMDVLKFWGFGIIITIVIWFIGGFALGISSFIGTITHKFIGGLLGLISFVVIMYYAKYNLMRMGMFIGCETYKSEYNHDGRYWKSRN